MEEPAAGIHHVDTLEFASRSWTADARQRAPIRTHPIDGTVELIFWTEAPHLCLEIVDLGTWRLPADQPTLAAGTERVCHNQVSIGGGSSLSRPPTTRSTASTREPGTLAPRRTDWPVPQGVSRPW